MFYITAGESHGPKLTTIISGVPAGLKLDEATFKNDLSRRQSGYGRGGRQAIEKDRAQITSGVRFSKTTGSPISIDILNKDWENWTEIMKHFGNIPSDLKREVTPRPGHADLVGMLKTGSEDARDILERASARETAARVAAGSVARDFLASVGVEVFSWVNSIGSAKIDDTKIFDFTSNEIPSDLLSRIEFSQVRCPDEEASDAMCREIDDAKSSGESLGGTFRVVACGLVPGLGTYQTSRKRLTSELGAALFSIPAIKSVEFGQGKIVAEKLGTQVHDEIALSGEDFVRTSNNCGGLEGGMTNGMPLYVTCAMKPIPTCMNPMLTVNIDTRQVARASKERSDVCAVPACGVVAEAEVCMTLANAYIEMFGNTCMQDILCNIDNYKRRLKTFTK